MKEEYDPLTDDLIERLFAASRKAANDEKDILVEAADALEARAAEIDALKEEVRLEQVAKSIEVMFVEARGETIKCLQSDIASLRGQVHEWLAANAPGGWIDALRADAAAWAAATRADCLAICAARAAAERLACILIIEDNVRYVDARDAIEAIKARGTT